MTRTSWLEPAARIGYAARGVVYTTIGGLALLSVFGGARQGSVGGGENAVRTIGEQPFGQALLVIVGAGLFSYAIWRLAHAAIGSENDKGASIRGLERVGFAISGLAHGALGVAAFQMALGGRSREHRSFFADILAVDGLGGALMLAAGALVLGFAIYQLYEAKTGEFAQGLKTHEMSGMKRTWVVRLGRVGLSARGFVFLVIGASLLRVGLSEHANRVEDIGSALRDIASQPYGGALLTVTAAGLAAYGVFQLSMARYAKIPAHA